LGCDHRLDLVGGNALAVDALTDDLGDAVRQVIAEVGAHQRVLDHVELGGVHRTPGDQIDERCAERRRAALQSTGEPAKPALFIARVVGAVAHAGSRDTRFLMSPEEMGSRLLYRDGLMWIIDKPAGLAVHKGPE